MSNYPPPRKGPGKLCLVLAVSEKSCFLIFRWTLTVVSFFHFLLFRNKWFFAFKMTNSRLQTVIAIFAPLLRQITAMPAIRSINKEKKYTYPYSTYIVYGLYILIMSNLFYYKNKWDQCIENSMYWSFWCCLQFFCSTYTVPRTRPTGTVRRNLRRVKSGINR